MIFPPLAPFSRAMRYHSSIRSSLILFERFFLLFYLGLESPTNAFAFDEIFLGPAGERLPELFDSR
jgi:hypothetical protein